MKFENLKPIFIGGHRRSGTTLLSSLLDFHEEILMYPDDSKFFHLFYPLNFLNKKDSNEKQEIFIKKNISYLKDILLKKVRIKKEDLSFELLEKEFRLYSNKKNEWDDYLNAIMKSFYNQTYQSKKNIRYWAEKTTSSEIYAEDIFKKYKNAKFIQIIRDPRAIYASLKSGWKKHYKNFKDSESLELLLQSCIDRYGYSTKLTKNNVIRFGPEKYLVIKYEDLVKNHRETLNKIKLFLGLNYKIKNNPTIYGKEWRGNNFSHIKFKKINNKRSKAWKNSLTLYERGILDFHFNEFLDSYNYRNITTIKNQNIAASKHYKWRNFKSDDKADI